MLPLKHVLTNTQFHHLAISVADCLRSVQFYKRLGFKCVHTWVAPDKTLEIKHLRLGVFILEVFCYQKLTTENSSRPDLIQDLKVHGVRHFGIAVPDIDSAYKNVCALGIVPLAAVQIGRTGIRYFFIKDPDDIFVEIVQDDRSLPST